MKFTVENKWSNKVSANLTSAKGPTQAAGSMVLYCTQNGFSTWLGRVEWFLMPSNLVLVLSGSA